MLLEMRPQLLDALLPCEIQKSTSASREVNFSEANVLNAAPIGSGGSMHSCVSPPEKQDAYAILRISKAAWSTKIPA
jgi:hypothetical protein